jgi:putative ABC transport system permease protein
VIGETARTTVVGLVLGLVAAGLVAQGLKTQLFGISPLNPLVYAGAALALGAAALAATAMPLRRAVAADPTTVLREE